MREFTYSSAPRPLYQTSDLSCVFVGFRPDRHPHHCTELSKDAAGYLLISLNRWQFRPIWNSLNICNPYIINVNIELNKYVCYYLYFYIQTCLLSARPTGSGAFNVLVFKIFKICLANLEAFIYNII